MLCLYLISSHLLQLPFRHMYAIGRAYDATLARHDNTRRSQCEASHIIVHLWSCSEEAEYTVILFKLHREEKQEAIQRLFGFNTKTGTCLAQKERWDFIAQHTRLTHLYKCMRAKYFYIQHYKKTPVPKSVLLKPPCEFQPRVVFICPSESCLGTTHQPLSSCKRLLVRQLIPNSPISTPQNINHHSFINKPVQLVHHIGT